MIVCVRPWFSTEDHEPPSTVQTFPIHISSHLATDLHVDNGSTLSLFWLTKGVRCIAPCRVSSSNSAFSKKWDVNPKEKSPPFFSPTPELRIQDISPSFSELCNTLDPSCCLRCRCQEAPPQPIRTVGVNPSIYAAYETPVNSTLQHDKYEWGYLERCVESFPVLQSITLRLVDAKQDNEVDALSFSTPQTIQRRLEKRNQLWGIFDALTTPMMTMCLKSELTAAVVVKGQFVFLRHQRFTVRLRVESLSVPSFVHSIMEECTKCFGKYPLPFRIMPTTEIQFACPRHTDTLDYATSTRSSQLMGVKRVGGCSHLVKELYNILVIPLLCPNLFPTLGLQPPKGILLYGPPGTGKTHLARAFMEELESRWEELKQEFEFFHPTADCPPVLEIFAPSDLQQDTEYAVNALFSRIRHRHTSLTPKRSTLLFIDEIDTLCPSREHSGNIERRITAAFLTELDGLQSSDHIVLLAATNRPNSLDSAFRRAGRIDVELEVDVPSAEDRIEILSVILKQQSETQADLNEEAIRSIALDCHAFVAADLKALSTMAGVHAIHEAVQNKTFPRLRLSHFQQAMKHVKPSAMKEVAVEIPHVSWDAIGGYDSVKMLLKECVEWPIKHRLIFSTLGITAPRGVLLYGPPGCSKTLLAKAVATESRMNFISVKGPELFSKWVGESERAVRDVFRKARQNAPCIIFFDEIDALGGDRHGPGGGSSGVEARVLSQMLNEMDGIHPVRQVLVIGATNRPDLLDAALLRPGRLDRLVYVPLPDEQSRRAICKVHLPRLSSPDTDINDQQVWASLLASSTEGYSGAEIAMVCREACLSALRDYLQCSSDIPSPSPKNVDVQNAIKVTWQHIQKALTVVRPRISPELIQFFEQYNETLRK